MSEDDLLTRARTGDKEAVGALWDSHRRWVGAVLLAHRPATAELDDLLQEVAVIFVSRLADVRDPARLLPWLASVARNACRGAARKAQAGPWPAQPLPGDGATLVDPSTEDAGGGARGGRAREALDRTLAAVERLGPAYREPLLLRAVDGLGQDAIAAILDVPVTTVETRLARARRMLRQELADADPGRRRSAVGTGLQDARLAPHEIHASRSTRTHP